jgi:predicted translin family RNA/ssDNA-binding protein
VGRGRSPASPGGSRGRPGARVSGSLQRAQELLERLRGKLDELEQRADSADADTAVEDLAEIAELAKEIEAEIGRARADAGA